MLDKILRFLRIPHRDITGDDGTLYLRRFYLYRGKFHPHIYIHHILRSDYDRALHDHPWSFVSFIFWGSYVETVPFEFIRESAGFIHYIPTSARVENNQAVGDLEYHAPVIIQRPALHRHKLTLKKPVWTLVFAGKRQREWGFWTDKGFVIWYNLKKFIEDMM